jgi:hypothetical protein
MNRFFFLSNNKFINKVINELFTVFFFLKKMRRTRE